MWDAAEAGMQLRCNVESGRVVRVWSLAQRGMGADGGTWGDGMDVRLGEGRWLAGVGEGVKAIVQL